MIGNKKGFTLIELLAVIVILSIIMLIATPAIVGVIDDAKEGAARNSALGYISAVENFAMAQQLTDDPSISMNGTIDKNSIVHHRGNKPDEVNLILENGMVKSGTIQFGIYEFSYGNGSLVRNNS